jgi:hypothetical protein
MSFSHLATPVLWLLPVALQFLIAFIMLRRRLAGQFPVFFIYNLLVPARDIALYFLPYPSDPYSTVFWWGEAATTVLEQGIIIENTWHFVRPYPFLRGFLKVLGVVGMVASAVAVAMVFRTHGPAGADRLLEWILLTERSARFLQVSLLIVAIAMMSRLGLSWRHYSLGITAGFGVYAALDLVLLELRAHLHVLSDDTFVLLRSAAYNLGVLIWTFYFVWPQGGSSVDRLPGTDLANWNNTVTEHVDKWYRR